MNALDGNDVIYAGNGATVVDGGAGADTVSYRNASQAVTVNLYQNAAWGGSLRLDDRLVGIENVEGSAFADTLVGDANPNRLTGLGGNDLLYGEASPAFTTGAADVLDGGDGNDTLHGYAGNDTLDGGNGGDAIYGDAGVDTITYASRGVALVVSLDGLANDGAAGEADNVSTDVENVIGGLAADRITGSSAANALTGNGGDDTISGAAGNDLVDGGTGNDTLNGNAGNDTLYGQSGNDILHGNENDDALYGGDGLDLLYGDSGYDTLSGGNDTDTCAVGGTGTDGGTKATCER